MARIKCDVPDCTSSVEVEAYAHHYHDEAENEHDDPPGWLTYEGVQCQALGRDRL